MNGEKVYIVLDFSVFLRRGDRHGATNRGNHVEFVFFPMPNCLPIPVEST